MKTLTKVMRLIEGRVVKNGDCLLWTGATIAGSRPYVTINHERIPVRRLMAKAKKIYQPGDVTPSSCGNPLCVHPEHAMSIPKTEHMQMLGRIGGKDPKRLVTIKVRRHPLQKLEPPQIKEIRRSTEPAASLAQRFGVSKSLVSRVRRLEARQLLHNPFAGLGARK